MRRQAPGQRHERHHRRVPRHRAGSRPLTPGGAREPGGARGAAADAALARRRRERFRQTPRRRVRSARAALAFVESVGLCSTFHRFPDGVACLWEAVVGRSRPRWPRRSHHDAGVGLTWELKDILPARRLVYYGKLLRGRPLLVALDVFAAFYALVRGRQRARDYLAEYAAGRLSAPAKRLMDSLMRERPQYTRSLRADSFMLDPARTREFERAMAELQQGLWIAKIEERYEPTFSYRWDLLERWLPEPVAEGRRLSRAAAVDRLLDRYLAGAVHSTAPRLARLFALPPREVSTALARLEAARRVAIEPAPARARDRRVVSLR